MAVATGSDVTIGKVFQLNMQLKYVTSIFFQCQKSFLLSRIHDSGILMPGQEVNKIDMKGGQCSPWRDLMRM